MSGVRLSATQARLRVAMPIQRGTPVEHSHGSYLTPRSGSRVRRLSRRDLPTDTVELARYLIGKILVHDSAQGRTSGRIVETEAYVPGDAAGHAYIGETSRNRSLFLKRGHAYVYFIYGCWFAVNVSAETAGVGAGVLLRALVPIDGVDLMRRRRHAESLTDLARGPGRLASAMAITRALDGVDLTRPSPLWLGDDLHAAPHIGVTTRIGLSKEAHRPLRFYSRSLQHLRFISGPRRALTG